MKFDETMLSGYIDGELSDEERKVVEKRLAESPKDRELLRALTEIHTKLSAMPEEIFRRDPVQGVRERIAAERARPGSISPVGQPTSEAEADHLRDSGESRATSLNANDGPVPSRSASNGRSSATVWWALLALAASLVLVVGVLSQRQIGMLADNVRPATNARMANAPFASAPQTSGEFAGEVMMAEAAPGKSPEADDIIDSQALEADVPPPGRAFGGGATPPATMNKIRSAPLAADTPLSADAPMQAAMPMQAMPMQAMPMQALAMESDASPSEVSSTQPVQVFAIGDSAEEANQSRQSPPQLSSEDQLQFDSSSSIAIEVPTGYTDDALRMIVTLIQASDTTQRDGLTSRSESDRTQGDFGALESEPAAVLVKSSPERLAGLIQAMRNWSQQVTLSDAELRAPGSALAFADSAEQGPSQSAEATTAGSVASLPSLEPQSTSVDLPGETENIGMLSSELRRSAAGGNGFRMGENAERSLREGQVWILIQPTARQVKE